MARTQREPAGRGLAAELDLGNKLLACIEPDADFIPYGTVEDRFFELYPEAAQTLLRKYKHRWRDPRFRSSGHSMSVYLAHRLGDLEREGFLEQKKGPGEGQWADNKNISHWRTAR